MRANQPVSQYGAPLVGCHQRSACRLSLGWEAGLSHCELGERHFAGRHVAWRRQPRQNSAVLVARCALDSAGTCICDRGLGRYASESPAWHLFRATQARRRDGSAARCTAHSRFRCRRAATTDNATTASTATTTTTPTTSTIATAISTTLSATSVAASAIRVRPRGSYPCPIPHRDCFADRLGCANRPRWHADCGGGGAKCWHGTQVTDGWLRPSRRAQPAAAAAASATDNRVPDPPSPPHCRLWPWATPAAASARPTWNLLGGDRGQGKVRSTERER